MISSLEVFEKLEEKMPLAYKAMKTIVVSVKRINIISQWY